LLDTLASADDKFWPHENWPSVKFNLPLQVGATGGHGTGPYAVSSYTPGRHIRFEFGGGRQGYHEFTLQEVDDSGGRTDDNPFRSTRRSGPDKGAGETPLAIDLLKEGPRGGLLDRKYPAWARLTTNLPRLWGFLDPRATSRWQRSAHVPVLRLRAGPICSMG
jgi:hypothetical protein